MIEMEQKYRIEDRPAIEAVLRRLGAVYRHEENHRDHYFAPPDRDFRQTDEVLRLRCIDDQSTLTYKGPRKPGEIKSRPEIEAELETGSESQSSMLAILNALRYRPVACVAKSRGVWELTIRDSKLAVCLDSLEGIGNFLELEVVADESELPRVQAAIREAEKLLGLGHREDRSYLAMVLEQRGEK